MDDINAEEMRKLEEVMMSDDSEVPSKKKILELIENANLTDDLKDKFRSMIYGDAPKLFGSSQSFGPLLALLFVLIIFSIIFFFGYKLYKSIKEKEQKREEKKKAKQMKKKK